MQPASELLNPGLILTDGAMGTYFAQLNAGLAISCEMANLSHPELIRQIHQEYLAAGARLLRTNTFAAAAQVGPGDPAMLSALVRTGYSLAAECAGDLAYVAADFGPVYNLDAEAGLAAQQIVLDTFLDMAADLFIFETYADPDEFLPLCRQIREKAPAALIIASFTLSADGYTRKGLALSQLSDTMENSPLVDIWGLNCGIGPTHLSSQASSLPDTGKPLSLMPNSGYPRWENQRLVYGSSPEYFANASLDLIGTRTRMLGGCCGTTPRHIQALRQALNQHSARKTSPAASDRSIVYGQAPAVLNSFAAKLRREDFVVICELDPPRTSQMEPMLAAASQLQLAGIDALTLADSPLARVKMDSMGCAARIYRETGLPVLPHLCCRDRNANALRSSLLAGYSEGIRQVLAVTGDGIPESERGFVKPVFNLNSIGLLQLIHQMNQDLFTADPILMAAALDPGVANPDAELARVLRKKEQGASVILTQPLFCRAGLPLIRQVRAAGLKVLIGLMPLVSYRNAQFLSQEMPGMRIPAAVLDCFHPDQSKDEAIAAGIRITCEIAAAVRHDADGFYLITPFNRADIMVRLIRSLRHLGLIDEPTL